MICKFFLFIIESYYSLPITERRRIHLVLRTRCKSIVERRSFGIELDSVIMSEVMITIARRRRSALRSRLTRIEKDITRLESKMTLRPSDHRRIKRLLEQVKENDREFMERHLEVLNFIEEEDRETLEAEEKAYDAHGSRVMELRERLEEMEEVEKTESPTTTATPRTTTDPPGNLLK